MKIKVIILSILFMFGLCFTPAMAMEILRQKNVATRICFPIVDGAGDVVVNEDDAGLDSELDNWNDGAAANGFTDVAGAVEPIETADGVSGWYCIVISQAEMNYDYIALHVKTTTAGVVDPKMLIRTMVGDPLNIATTDDGGTINVTSGAIDTVTITTTASDITNLGGTAAATQINNQVVDVISTDTYAEIAAGAPSATPTFAYMMTALYEYLLRNKLLVTSSLITLYKDDGSTAAFKITVNDDNTTLTRSEAVAP